MDIDFYPDKNRVIRLIKEVANGQYKGDCMMIYMTPIRYIWILLRKK